LQTWTYKPQKRQDGSAFALTYSFLLRSCKPTGAFVISPLPPLVSEALHTAGRLRSAGITPLPRYYAPLRVPLAVSRLPGVAGYTAYPASANFSTGRGGLLQLLGISLPPCRRFHPAGGPHRFSQSAVSPAAFARFLRARPPGSSFRGHISGNGRNGGYPPPPVQIRTCPIRAYGSCLRY
jgi:hypothetical protein